LSRWRVYLKNKSIRTGKKKKTNQPAKPVIWVMKSGQSCRKKTRSPVKKISIKKGQKDEQGQSGSTCQTCN